MAVNVNLYDEYLRQKRERQAQLQQLQSKQNLNFMDKINVGVKNFQSAVTKGFLGTFEGLGDTALGLLAKGADLLGMDRTSGQLQDIIKFDVSDYLTNHESKVSRFLMNDYLSNIGDNVLAGHFGNNKANYGKIASQQQVAPDLLMKFGQGAGNVLGNIALMGVGAGGETTNALGHLSQGATIGAKLGQFGIMAGSAGGQQIQQALNEGKSLNTALMQGAISGSIEGATEMISGGIQNKLGVTNVIGSALIDTTFEGLEEVASDVAQPLVEMLTDKRGQSYVSVLKDQNGGNWEGIFKNMAEDFGIAFITSALMGGGEIASTIDKNNGSLQSANLDAEMKDVASPIIDTRTEIAKALNAGNEAKATALQAKLDNYMEKNKGKIQSLFEKYMNSKGVKLNEAQEKALNDFKSNVSTNATQQEVDSYKQSLDKGTRKALDKAFDKLSLQEQTTELNNSLKADNSIEVNKQIAIDKANELGVKVEFIDDVNENSSYNSKTNTWRVNLNRVVNEKTNGTMPSKNGNLVERHKALVNNIQHEFGVHAIGTEALKNSVYNQAMNDGYINDETYSKFEERYKEKVKDLDAKQKEAYIKEEISANMISKYFPTMNSFIDAVKGNKVAFRQKLANSLSNLFRNHKESKPAYMNDFIKELRKGKQEFDEKWNTQRKEQQKAIKSYIKEQKKNASKLSAQEKFEAQEQVNKAIKDGKLDAIKFDISDNDIDNLNYNDSKLIDNTYNELLNSSKNPDNDLRIARLVKNYAKSKGFDTEAYHGTTWDFNVFDKSKASPEGDMGKGFYLSSEMYDSSFNYADAEESPDLKNKIDRLADNIENIDEVDREEAIKRATVLLNGGENRVIEAYISKQNSIDTKTTLLDDEILDDYIAVDREDFDNDEDYYDEKYYQYQDYLGELAYDVQRILNNEGLDIDNVDDISQLIYEIYENNASISYAKEKLLSKYEFYNYANDGYENADYVNNEVLRAIVESLGYNTIEDSEVSKKFRGMNLGSDTTHYIVFKSSQIKLQDNVVRDNNGKVIPLSERFNNENDDIRYDISEDEQMERNNAFMREFKEIMDEDFKYSSDSYTAPQKQVDIKGIMDDLTNSLYNEKIASAGNLEYKVNTQQILEDMIKLTQLGNSATETANVITDSIMNNVFVRVENESYGDLVKENQAFKDYFVKQIKITPALEKELRAKYGEDYKNVASIISKVDGAEWDARLQAMQNTSGFGNIGSDIDTFMSLIDNYRNFKNVKKSMDTDYRKFNSSKEFKEARERLYNEVSSLISDYVSLSYDAKSSNLFGENTELETAKSKVETLQKEVEQLEAQLKKESKDNSKIQKKLDKANNELKTAKQELDTISQSNTELKNQRNEYYDRYRNFKKKFEKTIKELRLSVGENTRLERQTMVDTNAIAKMRSDLKGDKVLTTRFRQDIEKTFRDLTGIKDFHIDNENYLELVDMFNDKNVNIESIIDYMMDHIGYEVDTAYGKEFLTIQSSTFTDEELEAIRNALTTHFMQLYNDAPQSIISKKNAKIEELKQTIKQMREKKDIELPKHIEQEDTRTKEEIEESLTKNRNGIIESSKAEEKTRVQEFKDRVKVIPDLWENTIVGWVDAQHTIYKSIMENQELLKDYLSTDEDVRKYQADYIARYVVQRARSATGRANSMVRNGIVWEDGTYKTHRVNGVDAEIKGLQEVYKDLNEEQANEFEMYLIERHNIMRMSIEERLVYDTKYEPFNLDQIQQHFGLSLDQLPVHNQAKFVKEKLDAKRKQIKEFKENHRELWDKETEKEYRTLRLEEIQIARDLKSLIDYGNSVHNKPIYDVETSAKDQVEHSRKEVARMEKEHPDFKDRANNLYAYNEELLLESLASGRISQTTYSNFKKYYGDTYVPVFRTKNQAQRTGLDTSLRTRGYLRANGGAEKIRSIRESMEILTARTIRANAINNIGTMMDHYGYSAMAVKALGLTEEQLKAQQGIEVEESNVDDFENSLNEDNLDVGTDISIKPNEDELYEMSYYKDGKMQKVKITRNEVIGLQDLQNNKAISETVDIPTQAMQKIMTFFKQSVTNWNIFFSFRNGIKDLHDAVVYTRYTKTFGKNYGRAFGEVWKSLIMKKPTRLWKLYTQYGGGESGYFSVGNVLTYKQEGKFSKVVKAVPRFVEKFNTYIEQLPRFAEFISSVEHQENQKREGKLREVDYSRAVYDSQDITLNFGIHGAKNMARNLNTYVIPFFNAQIQGAYKISRTYFAPNKQTSYRVKSVITLAILGFAPLVANFMIYGDDDDYEQLSSYYKDNFYLIKKGKGKFIRIPKGRMSSMIATLADKDYNGLEKFKAGWDTLSPVSSLRSIFSPISDVASNTTWYGGTIVGREWEGTREKDRYTNDSSYFAKKIGKQFNVAPLKVDYLLDQYTGIFGDIVLPMTSNNGGGINEQIPNLVKTQYIADSVFKNNRSAKFYDLRTEIQYQTNEGSLQAKAELKYMNKMMNQIRDLQKQTENMKNDNEKRVIQASINALYNQATVTAKQLRKILDQMDLNEENYEDSYYVACASLLGGKGALEMMNNQQYEKATELDAVGINYDNYFNYYMDTKGMDKEFKTLYINKMPISKQNKYLLYVVSGYAIPKEQKKSLITYVKNSRMSEEYKTKLIEKLS